MEILLGASRSPLACYSSSSVGPSLPIRVLSPEKSFFQRNKSFEYLLIVTHRRRFLPSNHSFV